MKYKLFIQEEVYHEVEKAVLYYDEQRAGLGMELFKEWENIVDRVLTCPEGYEIKRKQFRHAILKRFPYLAIFEIVDATVVFHRFINVRKHPGKRYAKRKK